MDEVVAKFFASMILLVIIIWVLSSLQIRCRLGLHCKFTNTEFCEYSNWGKQTIRCDRCYRDLEDLGWVDMDTGERG